jgi:hypothetical protein
METGTTSYIDRMHLTERLNKMLVPFLKEHGFQLVEFGYDLMLRDEPGMKAKIKQLEYKASPAALMVKFSPDFIASYRSREKKDVFFMDAKTSITPVFFKAHIERIRAHSKIYSLEREDIGEIEREAWLVYNMFYPSDKVALIAAAPYQPKLIVAEWVSKIKCLWCFKGNGLEAWDCNKCPIFKSGGTFGVVQNEFAGGSKTPHTNIHFGKMLELKDFLKREFGINANEKSYNAMIKEVKKWPLNKPIGRVNWTQFNNAIREMRRKCPWLKHRWPRIEKEQTRLDANISSFDT